MPGSHRAFYGLFIKKYLQGGKGFAIMCLTDRDKPDGIGAEKMASVRKVNKAISKEFPNLDIQIARGSGYFYFVGDDGLGVVDSIFCHPRSAKDDELIEDSIHRIRIAHGG